MITIPTAEFVGLITDVAAFALDNDDLPDYRIIRLSWDGQRLHAAATDTLRTARSTWDPDDDEGGQDSMFDVLGGADEPWALLVDLRDAKELAKIYKLPAKEGRTPLTLTYDNGVLVVDRSRDTGHQAIRTRAEGQAVNFPDLRSVLDVPVLPQAVEELTFTGSHLAALGQVRQRGPLTLTFQGPRQVTVARVGSRFVAVLPPQPLGSRGRQLELVDVG